MCSFPACRNQGTKFLFCAVCGVPVSKRNFRNRHHHERQNAAWNITNDVKACYLVPHDTTYNENTSLITANLSQKEGVGISSVYAHSSNQARKGCSTSDYPSPRAKRRKRKLCDKRPDSSRLDSFRSITREDMWLAVLDMRPSKDDRKGSNILAWLEMVKLISDKKKPVSEILSSCSNGGYCKSGSVQDRDTSTTVTTNGDSSSRSEPSLTMSSGSSLSQISLGSSSYESSQLE